MGVASDERQQLCDLFERLGPEAPTLCEGWVTRDLAAHLAVREHRPDALEGLWGKVGGAGQVGSKLAERAERVRAEMYDKPWPELIEVVRQGPPKWNPLRFGAVDELVNGFEYFVHHEDVRRAQPDWQPRPSTPDRDDVLWKSLSKIAKVVYGRSPVGVALRRPDGTEVAAKSGPRTVRILGEVGELVLHAASRRAARVTFEGNEADVHVVEDVRRRF